MLDACGARHGLRPRPSAPSGRLLNTALTDVRSVTASASAAAPASCRHEQTPVDKAFSRGFQSVVDVINSFTAPSRAPDGVGVGEEEEGEGGSAEGVVDMEAELGGEGAANPGAEEQQ